MFLLPSQKYNYPDTFPHRQDYPFLIITGLVPGVKHRMTPAPGTSNNSCPGTQFKTGYLSCITRPADNPCLTHFYKIADEEEYESKFSREPINEYKKH